MDNIYKSIPIPDWWEDRIEEGKNYIKDAMIILGVPEEKIEESFDCVSHKDDQEIERVAKDIIKEYIKPLEENSITNEMADKLEVLFALGNLIGDYCWKRFKLENLGTEFGSAKSLKYDMNNKLIYIADKSIL